MGVNGPPGADGKKQPSVIPLGGEKLEAPAATEGVTAGGSGERAIVESWVEVR